MVSPVPDDSELDNLCKKKLQLSLVLSSSRHAELQERKGSGVFLLERRQRVLGRCIAIVCDQYIIAGIGDGHLYTRVDEGCASSDSKEVLRVRT